jgi:hypothetical protein
MFTKAPSKYNTMYLGKLMTTTVKVAISGKITQKAL